MSAAAFDTTKHPRQWCKLSLHLVRRLYKWLSKVGIIKAGFQVKRQRYMTAVYEAVLVDVDKVIFALGCMLSLKLANVASYRC